MRRLLVLPLFALAVSLPVGCQSKADPDSAAGGGPQTEGGEPQTKLFLNIEVRKIGLGLHQHFSEVDGYGSQVKSEPGSVSGFMAMNGRKFQRFQIEGSISDDGRKALYAELQSELASIVEAHDAKIVGEIEDTIRERPIWLLSMISGASSVNLEKLEGFYFEYSDESGNGFVDVIATQSAENRETDTWHLGFAIHEPYQGK